MAAGAGEGGSGGAEGLALHPLHRPGRLGVRLGDSSRARVSGSAPGAASGLGFGSPKVQESQKLKLGPLIQVFYFLIKIIT